jgi:hypothetical protein
LNVTALGPRLVRRTQRAARGTLERLATRRSVM